MVSLTFTKQKENRHLTVWLEGRLDTSTAPLFEEQLREELEGIEYLFLDMEKLEYLSSAGLRVILAAQKRMNGQGEMLLRHVPEVIMEIFDVTGFADILTIE